MLGAPVLKRVGVQMSRQIRTSAWLAGTALAGLVCGAIDAQAGGFALREQSVVGQGASFAGVAAGGAASSMFWNPATMTQQYGLSFESGAALIVPNASHSYSSSTLATAVPALFGPTTENSGDWAVVPSSYTTYQFNDRFWVGMSVNAPYGLSVSFPKQWAGAGYAQDTDLKTYSFGPSAAVKVNDWISVGGGLQVQYMKASYGQLGSPVPTTVFNLSGSGWAFGWTAGVTLTPLAGTEIGLGYRSALNQKLDGNISGGVGAATNGSVELTVNLPDVASLGIRQRIGDSFTLLGTIEWTNWSRIGTSNVLQASGAPALSPTGAAITLPFQYDDGWFYSIGGEYVVRPNLTLRAGIGYEKSPVTDNVRTPRLPDNDRYWFSAGASYKPAEFPGLVFDLAYTYIDVVDTHIDISAASGNPWLNATGTYIGDVNANVHIFSVGARYKFPEPAQPLITKG
jgi:long-chain fatty acid transport protein